jgi:TPR repeat protein
VIYRDIEEMKQKAAEGEMDAIVQLGISYLYGYGIEIDYVQAFQYLQDAAMQNDGQAQLHLGKMYENGWGMVKKDEWTALSLYRRAYKTKTPGSRDAFGKLLYDLAEALPVTGSLSINNDFRITVCCEHMRENIAMGRVLPFEDVQDEANFYICNTNRDVLLKECPYCGVNVKHT